MSLGPGSRLGPYEIESAIGAGGMGEVYKARDTRLNRTVALKVLPEHVRGDPQFRQRFEREARAIAALKHPHICVLHDIGREGEIDFLVMEHLEGRTLADRLASGALPVNQALEYGIQIADGLDAAHRAGIVHRDLKPGNIMLTSAGVKLLDFGVARLVPATAAAITGITTAALQNAPLTGEGAVLGTLDYMSPEQLWGKDADARSDIFAFGTVLYEMLTGHRTFQGTNVATMIASVLSSEPAPVSTFESTTPPALDRLVTKCLAKDPDDRWQTARDLRSELQWIVEAGAQRPAGATGAPRLRPSWSLVFSLVLVVAVLASTAFWSLSRSAPAPLRTPVRLSIPLLASEELFGIALSPDGETLVYAAGSGTVRQLYQRALDQLEATPLPGGSIKKVPLAGGQPLTIHDRTSEPLRATNATWGVNDRVVFGLYGDGARLYQTFASGGIPQTVTSLAPVAGETNHRWPELLPGGKALLYTVLPSGTIVAQSLETGARRDVIEGAQAHYIPSGHIVFVRGTSLWAVPFDLDRLLATGPAVPVVEGISTGADPYERLFTVAGNGTLAYSRGQQSVEQRLVWVTRDGREEILPIQSRGPFFSPRLSPDGKRLVMARMDESRSSNWDIWVYDLTTKTERQLGARTHSDRIR